MPSFSAPLAHGSLHCSWLHSAQQLSSIHLRCERMQAARWYNSDCSASTADIGSAAEDMACHAGEVILYM